jgi:hypothetical protein
MYWPRFSEKKFHKKLRSVRKRSGISCVYIRWSKQVGLKIYRSKRERNLTVARQRLAAEHSLGPRVGELIEVEALVMSGGWEDCVDLRHKILYCYFTEHVEPGSRKWCRAKELDLKDKLQQIGLYCSDLHHDNVGRRGKSIVCLDFGSEGCSKGKPRKGPFVSNDDSFCSDSY